MSLDPYYHYHSEKASSIVGALIIVDFPQAITITECLYKSTVTVNTYPEIHSHVSHLVGVLENMFIR